MTPKTLYKEGASTYVKYTSIFYSILSVVLLQAETFTCVLKVLRIHWKTWVMNAEWPIVLEDCLILHKTLKL